MRQRWVILATFVAVLLTGDATRATASPSVTEWTATWSAAMQAPLFAPPQVLENQTLRQIVRVSLGGNVVRVRVSNALGVTPLEISAASVALRQSDATVQPTSVRKLTFGAAGTITIPPGAVAVSDAVRLTVPDQADLAIDLYLAKAAPATTQLTLAHQTSYLSKPGNFTGSPSFETDSTITSWYWLSGVEVRRSNTRTVVAFGDSITEGYGATTDANTRWPDVLARRLLSCREDVSIVNTAISGNRVLNDELGPNAQRRLDADLLLQAGADFAILLEGINDIGFSESEGFLPESVAVPDVSAEEIIAGYRQIIRRAHAQGIRLYGGTLLPYAGAEYYSPEGEAKRQAVNAWIRTSGEFDAVIDFDAVTRDPIDPTRLLAEFDSGDHLHPNDAGYAAMGQAVDLALFCGSAR